MFWPGALRRCENSTQPVFRPEWVCAPGRDADRRVRSGAAGRGAAWYLARIDRLFRIDARARRVVSSIADEDPRRATALDRIAQWRERFSMPILQLLFARATTELVMLPPKTALATALGYL